MIPKIEADRSAEFRENGAEVGQGEAEIEQGRAEIGQGRAEIGQGEESSSPRPPAQEESQPEFDIGKLQGIADQLDDNHLLTHEKRFAPLNDLSAAGLYYLATRDLYTSSFNGVLPALFEGIESENTSLRAVMKNPVLGGEADRNFMRKAFLDNAVAFAREADVLDGLKPFDEKQAFMKELLEDVRTEQMVGGGVKYKAAIVFSSFLEGLEDHQLLAELEVDILAKYNGANGKQQAVWGRVVSEYLKAHDGTAAISSNQQKLESIASQYPPLRDYSKIENVQGAFFDVHGNNHQMYIFYNEDVDNDGIRSYGEFKKEMLRDGWSLAENPNSGIYRFQKSENGRTVHLHVAMVEELDSSQDPEVSKKTKEKVDEIRSIVAAEGGKITVVGHRGHSYFLEETLKHMNEDTLILHGGGCGGNKSIESILRTAPNVHPFLTAGIGSMWVNNPTIRFLGDELLSKDVFEWGGMKEFLGTLSHSAAKGYIIPSDNMSLGYHTQFGTPLAQRSVEPTQEQQESSAPVLNSTGAGGI